MKENAVSAIYYFPRRVVKKKETIMITMEKRKTITSKTRKLMIMKVNTKKATKMAVSITMILENKLSLSGVKISVVTITTRPALKAGCTLAIHRT